MSFDPVLQTLIVESRELLQAMEDSLLQIENTEDKCEHVNAIFRAAHTIKGSAGLFGLDDIVGFTHVLESVLDKVRNGSLTIDSDMVALFLKCGDQIAALIDNLEAGGELEADARANGEKLVVQLKTYLGDKQSGPDKKQVAVTSTENRVERECRDTLDNDNWHILLRFGHDVLRNGMDPLSFFRYLGKLGEIVSMITLHEGIPDMTDMDPETCYMGYEISFRSNADKAEIEGVFEFVRDDCKIYILPPHSLASDFISMIRSLPGEEVMRIGEILVKCGTLTQNELSELLEIQSKEDVGAGTYPRPIGELAVEQGMVQPGVVEAALNKQKQVKESKAHAQQLVRVDAEKLDMLVNLVGELVIAASGVNVIAQRTRMTEMLEVASTMNRLVEEVRDGALNLRMVQIGDTFNRFQRVVRDMSKDLGKNVELLINGAETELDKLVVEKIGDPLTHLVRNSMDHGIESCELRQQRGKPARATVRLNAYHESGCIVIEVSDDGGGLNRDKILAKAVEKGLVAAGQTLSDKEIYQLIFEAGFSTADKVSNISGRGVGMDVVRRNIEALRGTIEIESELNVGTTMRIRLPLTLAIIDGFLVGVGKSSYVIPLDLVVECVDLSEEDRSSINESSFINLRGEVLPFMNLRELFKINAASSLHQSVVVVQYGSMRAGLVVDNLVGEFQTVIKPLGKLFENMKGIGGSTILGNGEVALILDVPNLVQMAIRSSQPPMEMAA